MVIHVVGSRGDVQPFLALGKVLKETYGHRVRLATHPVFKGFVEENGLEFFSIGGDPSELMAFMVKNPGLMPGFDTLRSGDIGKRRKNIADMVAGCWRSCIEAGDGTGAGASDNNILKWVTSRAGINVPVGVKDASHHGQPFIADAIIANPPSFAHVHCAEKLGVPLHMMFTYVEYGRRETSLTPVLECRGRLRKRSLTRLQTYSLRTPKAQSAISCHMPL